MRFMGAIATFRLLIVSSCLAGSILVFQNCGQLSEGFQVTSGSPSFSSLEDVEILDDDFEEIENLAEIEGIELPGFPAVKDSDMTDSAGESVGGNESAPRTVGSSGSANSALKTVTSAAIYVAVNGNDKNDGSEARPVATLDRAAVLVEGLTSTYGEKLDITVYVSSGHYLQVKTTVWRKWPSQGSLTIQGYGKLRPVMDGRLLLTEPKGSGGGFMSFSPSRPENYGRANIRVNFFTVQYFREGISFMGDTLKRENFLSHISVERVSFLKMGVAFNKTGAGGAVGMAVIRLANVRDSEMNGNDFVDIMNASGSGLHAYYLAHFSQNNKFVGNRFINHTTGSAIKFRDQSHGNRVESNYFKNVLPSVLQVKHCDPDDPAVKQAGAVCSRIELPSFNNVEKNNKFLASPKPINVYALSKKWPSAKSGDVYDIQSLGKPAGNFLIRSLLPSGIFQYGFCKNESDCATSTGTCWTTGTQSGNWRCENTRWLRP